MYGKPCSTTIDLESLVEYRENCLEMSTTELDIAIRFQLFHHRQSWGLTQYKKHKSKEKEKSRQDYFFNGQQICRETFAFVLGVNKKKNDAIGRSLVAEVLDPLHTVIKENLQNMI